jgi:beta-galactosidase
MYFGVDYYPEHWDETMWEPDLRLMKEARFNMVRIAEFAWSRLEPREGEYDFAWLDRFLKLCEQQDMLVMMGIPARNVPSWLIKKFPDLAVVTKEGTRESFGSRYTICLNHPYWPQYALRLAERMAERYESHPLVRSWHLDNEYGDGNICYCEHCRIRFTEWLKEKYGTIQKLNAAWGLVFWSLDISDWDELWLPAMTNRFGHNPGLLQDYRRFVSWTTEQFVMKQGDTFRKLAPDQTITTNLQSMTRYHTDYYQLSEQIDMVSTNYYPPLSYNSADLDLMRSLKNQNFWVVEQKSGPPGFAHNGYLTPAPGETRMYTYQAIGHGADAILYFRWRPINYGQEQFHKGILDYDSKTNRIFKEISRVGEELQKIAPAIKGTTCQAEVAILFSCDSRWALEHYFPHPDIQYRDYFLAFYLELQRQHVMADLVQPKTDLSKYKAVFAPLLYLMDQEIADNLARYVEQGGTLVYTFRSGAKDEYNNVVRSTLRPVIRNMLGIEIEESFALHPQEVNFISAADGDIFSSSRWVDLIQPVQAEVIARYESQWYKGYPAVTTNGYGKGKAYYIGTFTEDERFYESIVSRVLQETGVQPLINVPREVEVTVRTDGHKTIYFIMNRTSELQEIVLSGTYWDVIQDMELQGRFEIEPFGVRILTR